MAPASRGRCAGRVAGAVMVCAAIAACGSSSAPHSRSPSPSPHGTPGGAPVQGTGCVSQSEATQIWTNIDSALNAMEADPRHADPSTVTTGPAMQGVQQYLDDQLIANNLTEHEVDKLESLTVVNAGCNNATLQLRATVTLVTDDYLTGSGQLDHSDPSAGHTLHFLEYYQRSGSTWKETQFQNLDQPAPSPTPQLL